MFGTATCNIEDFDAYQAIARQPRLKSRKGKSVERIKYAAFTLLQRSYRLPQSNDRRSSTSSGKFN